MDTNLKYQFSAVCEKCSPEVAVKKKIVLAPIVGTRVWPAQGVAPDTGLLGLLSVQRLTADCPLSSPRQHNTLLNIP